MKIWVFAIAACLLVTGAVLAAGIDGKWTGQYKSAMGGDPMNMEFTFKANGNVLTGTTIGGADGKHIPIKDGKINGNNISFVVEVDYNGMQLKFNYKGVLSGDEIKLTFEMAGGGMGGPGGGPGGGAGGPGGGGGGAAAQGFTVKRAK